MKLVALLLLAGVFIRHDTAFLLAEKVGRTPANVFYIMGGMWEIALCAVLLLILSACRRDLWTALAKAACVIGIVEGLMISGCSIALGGPPPPGTTTCNVVTGLPIGVVVATMEAFYVLGVFGWHIGQWTKGEGSTA